jgi:hypothetical protein
MTLEAVLARLQARRDELHRLGALVDAAALYDDVIAELAAVRDEQRERLYSLAQAAEISGYSTEHLARLVRAGKIPNAGKKGSPRIRGADLPTATNREFAAQSNGRYDSIADARKLVSRRKGGPHGLA